MIAVVAPQDDRFAEAVDLLNQQLAADGQYPLGPYRLSCLRQKATFREQLSVLESFFQIDIEPARRLLEAWHAWHS